MLKTNIVQVASWRLLLAVAAFLLCVVFIIASSPEQSIADTFGYLFLWDSWIFQSIAENGYQFQYEMSDPARNWQTNNVAYPPLYPFLGSVLHGLFNLSWISSLVLVSQISCLLSFVFIVLIAEKLRINLVWQVFVFAALFAYPGSIWLFAAYSDPLSLALAFSIILVALGTKSNSSVWRAVLLFSLGMLLGLTHFRTSILTAAGFLIAVTWWLRGELDQYNWRKQLRIFLFLCLPVLGAAMGMGLFFLYCHWAFGRWDAYQQTIFGVWGVSTPDFLQIFQLEIYEWLNPSLEQDRFGQSTPYLGRFLASWFLTLSILLLILELIRGTFISGSWKRISCTAGFWLLLLSLAMQYFLITMRVPSLSNFISYPMPSVRYLIPCALLLALYTAQLIPQLARELHWPRLVNLLIPVFLIFALLLGGSLLQPKMLELFNSGVLQG